MNTLIYTDSCSVDNKADLTQIGIDVSIRDSRVWDISYLAATLTNPSIELIVINRIEEQSIAEMGVAAFLCKDILLTSDAYTEYPKLSNIVTHIDTRCNLNKPCNFISWYNYTYGTK